MHIRVTESKPDDSLPLRTRHRAEMNCQIVHDSIFQRDGWTRSFLLYSGDVLAGFATVAIAGPWKDKPTFLEFYVLPEFRVRAFAFFEAFLGASSPAFFEIQSNDTLAFVMACTYGRD